MKTNQILKRPMGDFSILQRTSDGMFNATQLLKQWNEISTTERKMDNFFKLKGTESFIKTIVERENLHTPKLVYVKSKASRGENTGTWMHPLLFIDFAMWINSEFKYEVLKFVYDQLILYRNEAGDSYQNLTKQVSKLVSKDLLPGAIQSVARGINHNVFGDHERNIRNKMAEERLMKDLVNLQDKIIYLIEDGFLKSIDDVIRYLRISWRKKYEPKTFKI